MLYGQDLFIDLAEKPRKKSVQIERGSYFVACSGERMSKIQICFCDVHLLSLKTIKIGNRVFNYFRKGCQFVYRKMMRLSYDQLKTKKSMINKS